MKKIIQFILSFFNNKSIILLRKDKEMSDMGRQQMEMYKNMLTAKHNRYNNGDKVREVNYIKEKSSSNKAVFKVIGENQQKEYTVSF